MSELEYLVRAARAAGMSADQLGRFVQGGYIPTPKQVEFHAAARECDQAEGPRVVAMGGSRGGAKSHAKMAQAGLDDCARIDNLKCLFLRKIKLSAAESMEDLVYKVYRGVLDKGVEFVASKGLVKFPNGSRILIGGFNNESDIEKYIGIEYDLIMIEDVTLLSWEKVEKLWGSMRSTRPDWRTRMYWSANPGGIGHFWFKEKCYTPWVLGEDSDVRFIYINWWDNPWLKPEYTKWLQGLTGHLGETWGKGNFDTFEGMGFPGFRSDKHICEQFKPPEHWAKWVGIDWGSTMPFVALWFTKNPSNGRIYVYRELSAVRQSDTNQAKMILDHTGADELIIAYYADPAMWGEKLKDDEVYSTTDEYRKQGIILRKGNNKRIDGKRAVERLLGDLPDGEPGLVIMDNCKNLIRTLPNLPLDENNPEDITQNSDIDHWYDALRYGLTHYPKMWEQDTDAHYVRVDMKKYAKVL